MPVTSIFILRFRSQDKTEFRAANKDIPVERVFSTGFAHPDRGPFQCLIIMALRALSLFLLLFSMGSHDHDWEEAEGQGEEACPPGGSRSDRRKRIGDRPDIRQA